MNAGGRSRFDDLLGLRYETLGDGKATVVMPYRADLAGPSGAIHSGAVSSLCESCFAAAAASLYEPGIVTNATAMSCNFLAPATAPHDLVAEASVLKAGRRIVYGEVRVRSGDRAVAHATLNFLNTGTESR